MDDEFTPETQPTGDYEVGYKKPPKSGQWQEGQSGNPKGRPKRSNDIAECLDRRLAKTGEVMVDGRLQKITYADGVALQMLKETLAGNAAARRDVIRLQQMRIAQQKSEQPDDVEIVIEAKLVFDGEEHAGWNRLAADNANLKKVVEQLESQLNEVRGSRLLPPPPGPAENSL